MEQFELDKERLKASLQDELDNVSLIEDERNQLAEENAQQQKQIDQLRRQVQSLQMEHRHSEQKYRNSIILTPELIHASVQTESTPSPFQNTQLCQDLKTNKAPKHAATQQQRQEQNMAKVLKELKMTKLQVQSKTAKIEAMQDELRELSLLFQGDKHQQIRQQKAQIHRLAQEKQQLCMENKEYKEILDKQKAQFKALMNKFEEYRRSQQQNDKEKEASSELEARFKNYLVTSHCKMKEQEQRQVVLQKQVEQLEQKCIKQREETELYKQMYGQSQSLLGQMQSLG